MKSVLITMAAALAVFSVGCKKKQAEPIPQPKAEQAAEKTSEKPPETAAGNYLRNRVGQIDKAKAAKALYEKSAQESLGRADNLDAEGN